MAERRGPPFLLLSALPWTRDDPENPQNSHPFTENKLVGRISPSAAARLVRGSASGKVPRTGLVGPSSSSTGAHTFTFNA